ncbi:hypothetical protein O5274_28080, partial [Escherichia coli]|nr:hypothetical protein [Escherichia coli]
MPETGVCALLGDEQVAIFRPYTAWRIHHAQIRLTARYVCAVCLSPQSRLPVSDTTSVSAAFALGDHLGFAAANMENA